MSETSEATKPVEEKLFPIITDMTNAEERVFARHAEITLGEVVAKLGAIGDAKNESEFMVVCSAALLSPWTRPAFMLIAAKREMPTVTIDEVIEHLDADEWDLDFQGFFTEMVENAKKAQEEAKAKSEPADPPVPSTPMY